jgi:hypothetical protein
VERKGGQLSNGMNIFEGVARLDDKCVDAIGYKSFREVIPPVHEF